MRVGIKSRTLFQLTTASPIDDAIKNIQSVIQNILAEAEKLLESARQQYGDIVSQLQEAAKARIEELLENFKKSIVDRFQEAAEAASRVPSCLQAQEQNLTAIRDDARK